MLNMDPLINPRHHFRPIFGSVTREVQHGQGFFSIFSKVIPTLGALFKRIAPVAKKVAGSQLAKTAAKELRNQAIDVGLNLATDLTKGDNALDSLKKHSKNAGESLAKKMIQEAKEQKKRVVDDDLAKERRMTKRGTEVVQEGTRLPPKKKFKTGFGGKRKKTRRDIFT